MINQLIQNMILSLYQDEIKLPSDLNNHIEEDSTFVAKVSVHSKEKWGQHDFSHKLGVALMNHQEAKHLTSTLLQKLVKTPQDMMNLMHYQLVDFGKPIPNRMKKAFADIFPHFSEDELKESVQKVKSVSLKDILLLTHPKPLSEEQNHLWRELLEGTLKQATTSKKEHHPVSILKGVTLLSSDATGSMNKLLSPNSLTYKEKANEVMRESQHYCEETIVSIYGTDFEIIPTEYINRLDELKVGWETNPHKVIDYLTENKIVVDRIIFFSDKKIEHKIKKSFHEYKKQVNPNMWVHIVNFEGENDQSKFDEHINVINKWESNAKMHTKILLTEEKVDTLIEDIKALEI